MNLSAEQIEQIRRNKEKALQIRAKKERRDTTAVASSSNVVVPPTTVSHSFQSINRSNDIDRTKATVAPGASSSRVPSNDCMIIGQTSATVLPTTVALQNPDIVEVPNQKTSVTASTVPSTSSHSHCALTDDQKSQIQRNKERALRLREEKMKQRENAQQGTSVTSATTVSSTVGTKDQISSTTTKSSNSVFDALRSPSSIEKRVHAPPSPATNLPKSKISVYISVADERSVKVYFTPYNDAIVEALRAIRSRRYDPKTRNTYVSFEEMKATEQVLKDCKRVIVTIESTLPDNVYRILSGSIPNSQPVPSDLHQFCGHDLIEMAYPYQIEGIRFSIHRNGRVLIADEMGLGKSIQALGVARYFRSDWPLVIVCPASMTGDWQNSIGRFLESCIRSDRVSIIGKKADKLPTERMSTTVIIMSYDQMVIRELELKAANFSTYIFDESHMLKDNKAKRTNTATMLSKMAKRVILLSGTPALSRPAELFSQIKLVDPKLFPKYDEFVMRYCDGKEGKFGLEAKGSTNCEELTAILLKRIMIRRLKKDVMQALPKKTREVIILSGDKIDTKMDQLIAAKQTFENLNKMGGKLDQKARHDSLLEYYRQTGIVKASAVCHQIINTYFGEDREENKKIIVFAHHQIVLDTIQAEVTKKQLSFIRIDGSTPGLQRSALCDKFQNDPECVVAILSITAAGVGITLTAASVVVFAELHWTPGTLQQAEDRAHRVGQENEVLVQYMIAKNTADDAIFPMIQNKMAILGQVSLNSETFADAERTLRDYSNRKDHWRGEIEEDEEGADDERNGEGAPGRKRSRLGEWLNKNEG